MSEASSPLRPGDPERLGRYVLVGRLGEGGMGTVFLGHAPDGQQVAVKMIRFDLASEEEFRSRFRDEVERARQVPPFCTAEVLDADPDDEHPYLVVEYVDGPSLATVITERGPLSAANLHALAIGVATALTAIHGAGVVHRDLKPNNVLLAPGSPKVIDFGIARAIATNRGHTRSDQHVGTIAYMAPERFERGGGATPAADIFAWGAVVTYAGTGRKPFDADTPAGIAARILTQPPDLTGLAAPLQPLVAQALAKDPADRPTARELLDRLLGVAGTGSGPAAVATALARQPALRAAVEEAKAATEVGFAVAPVESPGLAGATTRLTPSATDGTTRANGDEPGGPDRPDGTAAFDPDGTAVVQPAVAAAPRADPAPPRRRSRVLTGAIAALAVLTVAAVVTVIAMATDRRADGDNGANRSPSAAASASAQPSASVPTGTLAVSDPLTRPGKWQVRDDQANGATCEFSGGLVVTRQSTGPYRCPGPVTQFGDSTIEVDVRLLTEQSCATIWFRFTDDAGGYALLVCADGYHLVTHGNSNGNPNAIVELDAYRFDRSLALKDPVRVTIIATGTVLRFLRDHQAVGEYRDSTYAKGRTVLGIFQHEADPSPPFQVVFANVEIRTPVA